MTNVRFGRRLPLPSTLQIRRDLERFIDEEAQRLLLATRHRLPANASWHDIADAQATASASHEVREEAISEAEDRLARDTRAVNTLHAEASSPEKGMAQLRLGLSENTLRSLRAED